MRLLLPSTLLALCFALPPASLAEEEWQPLFNGRDLTGWVVVNTAPSTWHFNDEGYLVCSGKPIGEIRTERMYQNFIMEIEWRHMKPKGNAGIFLWADDITARGQPFHRGIEVQVLENAYGNTRGYTTHGDIFPIHGATMTPINGRGGSRAFPTENRSLPSPQWNHYRIEARDGEVSLAVNGKVVTRGRDCSPRRGYICVESEGGVVHYRNARIRELPGGEVPAAQVAIADRGYRSLYTGVDLEGWQASTGWKPSDWTLRAGAEATALVSEEAFGGELGLLFDLRLPEGSGAPRLRLGPEEAPRLEILIDPEDSGLEPLLEPAGRWNRFEVELRGAEAAVTVNGRPWARTSARGQSVDQAHPLVIEPGGAADWANLFVRYLDGRSARDR